MKISLMVLYIFQNYKCAVTHDIDTDTFILRNRQGQMVRLDHDELLDIAKDVPKSLETIFTEWGKNESI